MMSNLYNLMLPTGILASVGSEIAENPWIAQYSEKIGIICIMGYFLWEKTRECKGLRERNDSLSQRLVDKCSNCELAKAANKSLIDDEQNK